MTKHFVTRLSDKETDKLKSYLARNGFDFRKTNHAVFGATNPGKSIAITVYESGKVVVQGKQIDEFLQAIRSEISFSRDVGAKSEPLRACWIGTDESGKGDYFGPLVVAAVYVDERVLPRLQELGVRDSKRVTDAVAQELAKELKQICRFSIVAVGPQRYNNLMAEMKNLNHLLAWGHARAIENLLNEVECEYVLTDRFGDESFVRNALLKKGKSVRLEQKFRAEDDVAVAAASILARDEFLRRLRVLSQEVARDLPKGASRAVEEAGRALVQDKGVEVLTKVAKLHFKTTQRVVNLFGDLSD